MSQDTARHVLDELTFTLRRYKEMGEKALAQVPDDRLHWRPDDEANSLAILIRHLEGNMLSRWTDFLTIDGEKAWRERDLEFEPPEEEDRESLLARWENGWSTVFAALEPLGDDDALRVVQIRGKDHTVIQAIVRQLGHYAYHVGQIVQLARQPVDPRRRTKFPRAEPRQSTGSSRLSSYGPTADSTNSIKPHRYLAGIIAITPGLLYFFGYFYTDAYYSALKLNPELLQISVPRTMLFGTPTLIALPTILCVLLFLRVLYLGIYRHWQRSPLFSIDRDLKLAYAVLFVAVAVMLGFSWLINITAVKTARSAAETKLQSVKASECNSNVFFFEGPSGEESIIGCSIMKNSGNYWIWPLQESTHEEPAPMAISAARVLRIEASPEQSENFDLNQNPSTHNLGDEDSAEQLKERPQED